MILLRYILATLFLPKPQNANQEMRHQAFIYGLKLAEAKTHMKECQSY